MQQQHNKAHAANNSRNQVKLKIMSSTTKKNDHEDEVSSDKDEENDSTGDQRQLSSRQEHRMNKHSKMKDRQEQQQQQRPYDSPPSRKKLIKVPPIFSKRSSITTNSSSSTGGGMTRPPTSDTVVDEKRWYHLTKVTTSRIIFLLCLAAVAAALGYGAYELLKDAEQTLAREQFESIADRALDMSVEIATRKRLGVRAMVGIMEETFPAASEWPYVYIKGYPRMAQKIMETTNGRSLGVLPLVWPDQLSEYEDFCYDVVFESYGFPNTTGVSPFGKGVFALDPDQPRETQRYKVSDVQGQTKWGSPYNFSFPYLYHSSSTFILMGDMHGTEPFGSPIDQMYNCSLERAEQALQHPNDEELMECGIVTDIVILNGGTRVEVKNGPGAVLFQPIYPANNPTTIVGLVLSSLVWDRVLLNVFTSEVSGVHCVLKTETQTHTYAITNGEATFL